MAKPSGLGAFGGVYTPSILTILGVIMYLRFGWVVGNVGLVGALAIVTLSTAIAFLTALSVSAIATDRVVRVGGAYYTISRSLGIETGGAVGIPLYFTQAISVGLYTVGFAESMAIAFPGLNQLYVGLLAAIGVAILALTSAEIAIRAQYFIMAAIAFSLISLIFGPALPGVAPQGLAIPATQATFWSVFAVFFPAVTGIMAGVSMSGDLRDPTRAIPLGTLAAVGTGYVIYMGLPVLLALRADTASLLEDSLVMMRLSFWKPTILLGVWGATLSSAIGSILGAPRVLQALARDGILPRSLSWLGRGNGLMDEPRLGTLVTLVVAIATVCIGELNLIAPVLTMFFLTTYLVLNVSAGLEGLLKSPSFRPTFRYPQSRPDYRCQRPAQRLAQHGAAGGVGRYPARLPGQARRSSPGAGGDGGQSLCWRAAVGGNLWAGRDRAEYGVAGRQRGGLAPRRLLPNAGRDAPSGPQHCHPPGESRSRLRAAAHRYLVGGDASKWQFNALAGLLAPQ